MKPRILEFKKIGIGDIAQVGGKNASLGEMITKLASAGIPVPDGFAITSESFIEFLNSNGLVEKLQALMSQLDRVKYANLRELGLKARKWILEAVIPPDLKKEVIEAYQKLSNGTQIEVAVRSSATAEDLPQASFAGQHDSYLNIKGDKELLQAVQKCYASLYTDRAIKYREDNGFAHEKVFLSIGVQKMVRSDKASSGVCFTLEPESGFRDIVHISGVWGLGENIVQGTVIPDEYFVFKPTLLKGKFPIIQKKLGDKDQTMIYSENPEEPVRNIPTSKEKREQYVLSDEEIIQIARWAMAIEDHYRKPMDLEWAKDGLTQEIFIIQARPETVQSRKNPLMVKEFELLEKADPLVQGNAVGSKITVGKARILDSPDQSAALQPGEIVVTNLTSPDWDPILMNAGGIITNEGGRTSHASIVARELGVPAVVGCGNATKKISDGEMITISCAEGKTGNVYRGKMAFREIELDFSKIRKPKSTKVMLIAGDPDKAFKWSFYPNDGVGLMRIEFIIMHTIQIHPMALVRFDALKDLQAKQRIEKLTHHYADKKQFFVDKLAEGIATIAASFYPKEVIVRMSDFKTNEYANLLGGKEFEPHEENPMIGFRGASRYYNERYREGFKLECEAIAKVRGEMGLNNVKVMIPFCRTVEEGEKVIEVMKDFGLEQGSNDLEIYVMAEIPSNVMLADQFARIFDGFSIGSNDLTQLTLGIDRDSAIISDLFNERNEAPEKMISIMIREARKAGVKIGLCGQAPSDYPEFAQFLVEKGIDSISFNPDALLEGIENINKAEKKISVPA